MPSLPVAVDASAGRCTHLSSLQVCELGQAEAPMSTEPQEAPARPATGRECGCPPGVVRCAHWEGMVLFLSDETTPAPCVSRGHGCQHLFLGKHPSPCSRTGCKGTGHLRWQYAGVDQCFDTRQGAEAEFFRQEAILLGNEDA